MERIINAANRLPITIGKKITVSSGGIVSALEGVRGDYEMIWLGWPGAAITGRKNQQHTKNLLFKDYGCLPVFLSDQEIDGYYHGFSNSSLWPILHYRPYYIKHQSQWWEQYKTVNQKFADAILKVAKTGDLVWVHDYQLMLVPEMLKQSGKKLKIGFFLHTPFPSYEVFRCHPQRKELLTGMLGADLIGFHTFGYLRHFRSSAMRLLGVECETMVVNSDGRKCRLGVFPIGADVQSFEREMDTAKFNKKRDEFINIFKGKTMVLSVERLDYSKGIMQKLKAIDCFLEKRENKNNIVFIFINIPSREQVPEYHQLRQEIESFVGRLNGKYATVKNTPVHFIYQSLEFTELCALYNIADIAMVTPLIDGMNLVAKEYVACKPDYKGVLLLSEFAGAANELFQAFIINPYDIESMVQTLEAAMTLEADDMKRRMKGLYERVVQFDAKYWAKSFINELNKVEIMQAASHRKVNVLQELSEKLNNSRKAAFFLDYDGTLCEIRDDPDKAGPDKNLKNLLEQLESKKSIDTYLISGRTEKDLDKWFEKYDITLIAEHGFSYRSPETHRWKRLIRNADLSWKKSVREILQQHVGTTQGSFIEEKVSSLTWHYRKADPEFGLINAQQLMSLFMEMLSNMPVEVHHGKKIIEVKSIHANKGTALMKFAGGKSRYDFVLCAGDDQTDENMFKVNDSRLFKIKLGQGPTEARYNVDSPKEFLNILSRIIAKRK
ncbi:MAG: Trehalose-phosphate synthase [Planctomycetes bacterium ADurb.Bin401]|nr:MAG: Trehalose-phosphate synthase [Planctomycetes bacterium ADurb.Bin401]